MASSSAHARVRWRCGTCAVRSAQYVLLSVASVFIDTAGFAATLVFVVTHGLSGWITEGLPELRDPESAGAANRDSCVHQHGQYTGSRVWQVSSIIHAQRLRLELGPQPPATSELVWDPTP